jgi:glycosyltransferase involved in cell wall biosynthesis
MMTRQKIRKIGLINQVALLISIYFPPDIGGGSTGAWNRALLLHKMGYLVFVLCAFPAYPSGKVSDPKYKRKLFYVEYSGNFTIIRLRLPTIQYIGFSRRLLIFLNFVFLTILYLPKVLMITGRLDVVYARAPVPFSSISGSVYSLISRAFFIYEAPDLWPEQLVILNTPILPLIMFVGSLLAKISFIVPDIIVTVSDSAAMFISRKYHPKATVYGIPIGVDSSRFPKIFKHDARQQLVKTKVFPIEIINKFIVMYSGIISNNQRVENLAYAAEKLLKDDNEIVILIIGEGDEKQKLQQLKIELNLTNLLILPSQPRDMMPSIISAADICAILLSSESIFRVALPSKFYEYVACFKPILGICTGELESMINSNNIGRTAHYGNIESIVSSIKELKKSPDIMKSMENNCHQTLQQLSLDRIASNFLSSLEKEMKLITT